MTVGEVKRVLSGIGIDTSSSRTGYIQIPNLKYFNFCSDGNQVVSYYNDLIDFDFDNEIIRLKEKNTKLVSGVMNTNGAMLNEKNIMFKYSPYVNNKFTFRKYLVGDTIYYVNKTTLKRNPSLDDKIINIVGPMVEVGKSIPNLNTYYMCYAIPNFSSATLDDRDNRTAMLYGDNTNYFADIYMTFESLAGFSFHSSTTSII